MHPEAFDLCCLVGFKSLVISKMGGQAIERMRLVLPFTQDMLLFSAWKLNSIDLERSGSMQENLIWLEVSDCLPNRTHRSAVWDLTVTTLLSSGADLAGCFLASLLCLKIRPPQPVHSPQRVGVLHTIRDIFSRFCLLTDLVCYKYRVLIWHALCVSSSNL